VEAAFIFDLDGTLVDSVYQQVLASKQALGQEGIALSVWRIHRKIGMSGGFARRTCRTHSTRSVADGKAPRATVSLTTRWAAQCLGSGGWLPAIAA
jgi:beta-phosphoglucomutase-like phosphatase (HAD superfamily)